MVHSKYLEGLGTQQKDQLRKELYERQSQKCFICEDQIEPALQNVDIDHVVPLNLGGKDEPNNFALAHLSCNREKQDSNLIVARCMKRFDKIRDAVYAKTGKSPDLSNVLEKFGGSKLDLPIILNDGKAKYTLEESDGKPSIYESDVFADEVSNAESFFAYLPIQYVFHDEAGINPRTLSDRVKELIKEFFLKRPQLHVGLARMNLDGNSNRTKIFVFDGQHKAAAQILLGADRLLLRVFVNPNLELLMQTNERAGTDLRQVAFDLSVRRQLGSTILARKIESFQKDKGLRGDDYSFSEKDLIAHYRGEGREIKKFILDNIRTQITNSKDNKLRDYVTFGGKEKDKPISYSAIEKTFFSILLSQDILDARPFLGTSRQNEMTNMIKLMNIIVETLLVDYDFTTGSWKIEEQVRAEVEGSSTKHTADQQLRVLRMTKEEIMYNWIRHMKLIITNYFTMKGAPVDETKILQEQFDETLWKHLRNFVKNLKELPLWVDREKTRVFSAKMNYDYWASVFKTGTGDDGVKLLTEGINLMSMVKE